jgi:hypothetical protein
MTTPGLCTERNAAPPWRLLRAAGLALCAMTLSAGCDTAGETADDTGQPADVNADTSRPDTSGPDADVTEVTPCDGVTCSDHGTCEVVADAPECVCSFGWEGTNCERCPDGWHDDGNNGCAIDETCSDGICGDHGTCDDSTGIIACDCDAGWTGGTCNACGVGFHTVDGDCVADDVCTNDACSGHGDCAIEAGIIACTCETGYDGAACTDCATSHHPNGEGACLLDQSCSETDPCSDNGTCSDVGGVVSCICLQGYAGLTCLSCYPGYHFDDDGSCVLDEQCLPNTCSGTAAGTCSDAGGSVACFCLPGYAGDNCDLCSSGHHRDDATGACARNETCGLDTCGANGSCGVTEGVVGCDCAAGYVGDVCQSCAPGFHTDEISGACVLDEQCGPNTCSGGAAGDCDDVSGVALCACTSAYTGANCANCAAGHHRDEATMACVVDDVCAASSCGGPDQGSCLIDGGVQVCACAYGFTGDTCGDCAAGFHAEGDACVLDQTCLDNTCSGHGDCTTPSGVIACACAAGYIGPFCGACAAGYHTEGADCVIDETCLADGASCSNQGDCNVIGGIARCDCAPGYASDDCSTCSVGFHIDADSGFCVLDQTCLGNTCSGNGACTTLGGIIDCDCAPAYVGDFCEACAEGYHAEGGACVIDEICGDDSCSGNGTCDTPAGVIACDCATGYTDDTCADCDTGYHDDGGACVIDEVCGDDSCSGNGDCDTPGGVIDCDCDTGYAGDTCADCAGGFHAEAGACVVDQQCQPTTCSGHGTCTTPNGLVDCACDTGYDGDFCGDCADGHHADGGACVIDEVCGADSCSGNGACTTPGGVIDCDCAAGYAGDTCAGCASGYHIDADACAIDEVCGDDTCSAFGTCVVNGGVTSCICQPGYDGDTCADCNTGYHSVTGGACEIDEVCGDSSCAGVGICTVAAGLVLCDCPPAYDGDDCEACSAGHHRNTGAGACEIDQVCGDDSCSGVGTCSVSSGVVSCDCDAGYDGGDCADCYAGFERDSLTGTCAIACGPQPGDILCGGSCIAAGDDAANCGGCGNTCDVGNGEFCFDGACATERPGDSCMDARVLVADDDGIYRATGDNGAPGLTNQSTTDGCEQLDTYEFSGDGFDEAWRLDIVESTSLRITVDPDNRDLSFVVFDGDTCAADSCVGMFDAAGAGGPEVLELEPRAAGSSLFIVVEGYTSLTTGSYVIMVEPFCASDCVPGVCGMADSCGNVCGCTVAEECNSGVCELLPPPPGDSCAEPVPLTADADDSFTGSGDTTAPGFTNAQTHDQCPKLGLHTPSFGIMREQVWSFTAVESGLYTALLEPTAGADLHLYAFSDLVCAPEACVGQNDSDLGGANESLILGELGAGDQRLIVVEGWSPSTGGAYNLRVERTCISDCNGACGVVDICGNMCGCGGAEACNVTTSLCEPLPPPPGDMCDDALSLTASGDGVWTGSGDTSTPGQTNAYVAPDPCSPSAASFTTDRGLTAPDEVWHFTVPSDGRYEVTLFSSSNLGLYGFPDEACNSGCFGFSDLYGANSSPESMLWGDLSAGEEVYIVVDGDRGDSGAYAIEVSEVCVSDCVVGTCNVFDSCGNVCGCGDSDTVCDESVNQCMPATGDSCADPLTLSAGGVERWVGQGNTAANGLSDAVDLGGCPQLGSQSVNNTPNDDEVWVFTAPVDGMYRVTATPEGNFFDLVLAAFVGADCVTDTCFGYVDSESNTEAESLTLTLAAGESVRLVVDSWAAFFGGSYDLEIVKVLPEVCANDLFFSEMVESTSFTKALEIVNFTGAPINLSTYEILKITNGNGTWPATGAALSGTLANNDVFVVCHGSSADEVLAACDLDFGSASPTNFNGNDALALAHNGVIIDVIGGPGPVGDGFDMDGLADATVDVTLVRDPNVTGPSDTWSTVQTQWVRKPANTFDGLGSHQLDAICVP